MAFPPCFARSSALHVYWRHPSSHPPRPRLPQARCGLSSSPLACTSSLTPSAPRRGCASTQTRCVCAPSHPLPNGAAPHVATFAPLAVMPRQGSRAPPDRRQRAPSRAPNPLLCVTHPSRSPHPRAVVCAQPGVVSEHALHAGGRRPSSSSYAHWLRRRARRPRSRRPARVPAARRRCARSALSLSAMRTLTCTCARVVHACTVYVRAYTYAYTHARAYVYARVRASTGSARTCACAHEYAHASAHVRVHAYELAREYESHDSRIMPCDHEFHDVIIINYNESLCVS